MDEVEKTPQTVTIKPWNIYLGSICHACMDNIGRWVMWWKWQKLVIFGYLHNPLDPQPLDPQPPQPITIPN